MVELTLLGSGSAGNCTAIRHGREVLLVDAGFSAAEMQRRLARADIALDQIIGIVVTHEHDDHVQGLRVFSQRHGGIPVYSNALTTERLHFLKQAGPEMRVFSNGSPFPVGGFQVEPFSVSHDAVDPVAYVVRCGHIKIAIATDFGHPGKMVPVKLHNSHILVLESNHEPELLRASGRPWVLQQRICGRRGHLNNQTAANLLPQCLGTHTRHLILAHLSHECNRPALVQRYVDGALAAMARAEALQVQIATQETGCPTIAVG